MGNKLTFPTLNIWQAQEKFKAETIDNKESELVINKREFLFLITKNSVYYIFKTENGVKVNIPISADKDKRIIRVF